MKLLMTTCLLLLSFAAFAQNTDQPDPLRPSTPDSARSAAIHAADTTLKQGNKKKLNADTSTRVSYRFRFTADGTFTGGNVNRSLLQLVSAFDVDVSKVVKLSSNPSFVYGRQGGLLNEREYFGDGRITLFHEKRLYYLAFGAFEKSNLRQILNRYTVAAGLGYKVLNHKRAYMSLTNVLLHENTDFAVLNDIDIWRDSARLFGEYMFGNDLWVISHTAFYQPALSRQADSDQPLNIRWNGSVSIQFNFSANLSFRTTFANSYESIVVPGRVNNDTRLTLGMTYERK